ncbi:interleukin-like EMT inducer domain-containing protein, partial [Parvimonas sp. M20]
TPDIFRIKASGNTAYASPFGQSTNIFRPDGSNITINRSYGVITFEANSNVINFAETFDVYGSQDEAARMAAVLNGIGTGQTVIVVTNDEPYTWRLARGLDTAMARVGAGEKFFSPNFAVHSVYVLVGRGGLSRGEGVEYYQGNVNQDPNAFLDLNIPMLDGRPAIGSS